MVWKKYPTLRQQDIFADAFYDENYKKMSKMLGKKITNLKQAEAELEKYKTKKYLKEVFGYTKSVKNVR
jgi:hypothetical protein